MQTVNPMGERRAGSRLGRWLMVVSLLLVALPVVAQVAEPNPLGTNIVNSARQAFESDNVSTSLTVVFLITILSLAPALLMMTTAFTRIIVVLGFLRQALGTQQTPPNQVLVGLALFLTFFIMAPVYREVNDQAVQPYVRGELTQVEAVEAALVPIREFMFQQTRPEDIKLFLDISGEPRPASREDVSTLVLMPAFMLSELTVAFQIGFIIYIPFLIIDMVVSSTLMAMGMMMLPPVFISLPFKLILFVLADGWALLVGSLVRSFQL